MSTSAPVKKEHDIPIVRPQRIPKELPAPNPERLVPIVPFVPAEVPERVRR